MSLLLFNPLLPYPKQQRVSEPNSRKKTVSTAPSLQVQDQQLRHVCPAWLAGRDCFFLKLYMARIQQIFGQQLENNSKMFPLYLDFIKRTCLINLFENILLFNYFKSKYYYLVYTLPKQNGCRFFKQFFKYQLTFILARQRLSAGQYCTGAMGNRS